VSVSSDEDEYREKKRTALWADDMRTVLAVMDSVRDALEPAVIYEVMVTVARDDGEPLAEVWYDGESESWLCNWLKGSGAA